MSTINQGILGGFSGKTGPVIGSSWKGRPVMRARPVYKKNRKFSPVQLAQQEKFTLMGKFLHGVDELLATSFINADQQQTGFNAAMAYNLHEAVDGLASPFSINYEKIRLAQGSLCLATKPVVEAFADNELRFSWSFTPGIAKTKPSDKAVVVLYSETTKQFLYTKDTGAVRSDGELTLDAQAYSDETVHAWFFFLSEEETKACDSVYLGTVDVAG
jgi:hypothetical protein